MFYEVNKERFDLDDQNQFNVLLDMLNDHYYNKEKALIEDEEFDRLCRQYQRKFHVEPSYLSNNKKKKDYSLPLPYFMPSLSKITDQETFVKFITKMLKQDKQARFLLSNKMD